MSASGPDERLSAFYDGDLSAVERAEVERLLGERPELQVELSRLSDLSQRLGELADDVPEFDLRPQLLQQVMVARRAAAPAPLRTVALGTRRRWMPLLLAACSLTLLVAAMLPLIPRSNQSDMVAMAPQSRVSSVNGADGGNSKSIDSAAPSFAMSAEISPGAALVSGSPVASAMSASGFGGAIGGPEELSSESANPEETGPSELLVQLEHNRKLKPGDILSQMVESGDVPIVINYTVVDVDRGARSVEVLILQNGIVRLVPSTPADNEQAKSHPPQDMLASKMKTFLIEAEADSLNTTILECNNLRDVVAINVEPLGLSVAEEAQVAKRNTDANSAGDTLAAPAQSLADTAQSQADADRAPAPTTAAPAEKSPALSRRSGLSDEESTPEKLAAAEDTGAPKRMSIKSDVPSSDALPPPSAELKEQAPLQAKRNSAASINGYSFAIENGDEMYAELQQRQSQQTKNVSQNSVGNQDLVAKNTPFSPSHGKQYSGAELNMLNGLPVQGRGRILHNGLQYGNSVSGGRSRLRAFIVLRPQSPPPVPPVSSPIQP